MITLRSKKHNKMRHSSQKGSVLALAMLVVIISMLVGTGLLMLGTQSRTRTLRRVQSMMARSAADAGVENALQQINDMVEYNIWSPAVLPTVFEAGFFGTDSKYSVKSDYDNDQGYTIWSTGTNRDRTCKIIANLRLKGVFNLAIQTRNHVDLKQGTIVEAINSKKSLDPDDTDETVVIGTNSIESGSIILHNGAIVDGDVVVGVGGDVSKVIRDMGASIMDSYALTSELEFPDINPPFLPLIGINMSVSPRTEKTIGLGGDFPWISRFSNLILGNGSTLRVVGDCVIYITGDVKMDQSSEIVIDSSSNASLTVYLDGNWISGNSTSVTNTTQNTSNFQLYATGDGDQNIDLKAKNDLFGTVYAPDADVTIYAGGDIYGAVVANNFELKNAGHFYYDVALQDVSVNDEGARFVISRWTEQ